MHVTALHRGIRCACCDDNTSGSVYSTQCSTINADAEAGSSRADAASGKQVCSKYSFVRKVIQTQQVARPVPAKCNKQQPLHIKGNPTHSNLRRTQYIALTSLVCHSLSEECDVREGCLPTCILCYTTNVRQSNS